MPRIHDNLWEFTLVGASHGDRRELFDYLADQPTQLGVGVLVNRVSPDGVEVMLTGWGAFVLSPPLSLGWLSARHQGARGQIGAPHPESDCAQFRHGALTRNFPMRADGVFDGITVVLKGFVANTRGYTVSVWAHRHGLYGVAPEIPR